MEYQLRNAPPDPPDTIVKALLIFEENMHEYALPNKMCRVAGKGFSHTSSSDHPFFLYPDEL